MQKLKFDTLALSKELLRAIKDMGFEEATPIQSQSIPQLLEGKDVIGQAMTGTGKTVAFGIPAIESVNSRLKKAQVVIMCPTRELAIQVAMEMGKLLRYKDGIHEVPIYGGQPIERQFRALQKGPQIIIGTPGRMLDHIKRGTLKLDSVSTVILDEADEMLNMGFIEDIEKILRVMPKKRQTVFFSATISKSILNLAKKYQQNQVLIKVVHEKLTVPKTKQEFFEVNGKNKLDLLTHLLDQYQFKISIIFCNTKRMVDKLVGNLKARGYYAEALHGDMTQSRRNIVMNSFRRGKSEILVATDVAARGIDVKNIEVVFNYDIPQDEEYYVHRIGRTGRAGKEGKAFTFVHGKEMRMLRSIENYTKTSISRGEGLSAEKFEAIQTGKILKQVKGVLGQKDLKKYVQYIEETFLDANSSMDIAAALLKIHLTGGEKKKQESDPRRPSRPSRGGAPSRGGGRGRRRTRRPSRSPQR